MAAWMRTIRTFSRKYATKSIPHEHASSGEYERIVVLIIQYFICMHSRNATYACTEYGILDDTVFYNMLFLLNVIN